MTPRDTTTEVSKILLEMILPLRAESTIPLLLSSHFLFLLAIKVIMHHLCFLVSFLIIVPIEAESVASGEAHDTLRSEATYKNRDDRPQED